MSTKLSPKEIIVAASDDDVIDLGEFRAQEVGNGGINVPYPQPHARNAGLEQSSPVEIYFHAGTGGIVVMPEDTA
jgi:hypothetical protein